MAAFPYNIYIDDTLVTNTSSKTIQVTTTGCSISGSSIWTYSGRKIFQGFQATGNVTSGTYSVGSTITVADQDSGAPIYLTTIEEEDKSLVKIAESKIQELADAVRTYTGSSDSYTLAQMASAISSNGTVTNLTGTTWYFNDSVQINGTSIQNNGYRIDFTCDNVTYKYISAYWWFDSGQVQSSTPLLKGPSGPQPPGGTGEHLLKYENTVSTIVLEGTLSDSGPASNWINQAYRTITITGGDDVANTDLINWLYENATLVSRS